METGITVSADQVQCLWVNHLQVRSLATGHLLLKDVSFSINVGEFVCIRGDSGSGKTLTALTIMRLLPSTLAVAGGEIRFLGHTLDNYSIRAWRGTQIAMVFQELGASFNPLLPIGPQVADTLAIHHPDLSSAERKRRVESAFQDVGIEDGRRFFDAYPDELSGGQLQRCILASTLLTDVKLLIADEPTGSLDSVSRQQVLELIARLRRKRALSVLIITHDLDIAKQYADRVVTIQEGYTKASVPAGEFQIASVISMSPKPADDAEPVLAVENLSKTFRRPLLRHGVSREVKALDHVSFVLHRREALGIVGKSGCGKTTLAHCLVNLIKPDSGTIGIDGQVIPAGERPQAAARRGIQLIWQDPLSCLNPVMTVERLIGEGLRATGEYSEIEIEKRVLKMLELVSLDVSLLSRRPRELSGGQCQRVAIARALIVQPWILVADEPVAFLDPKNKWAILDLLLKLRWETNLSLMIVSHEMDVIQRVCDRVAVMEMGRIVSLQAVGADQT